MYDPSKGVIAIATGYSGGKYTYSKINHDLLQPDTMKSTPDQMQDLNTYTNGKVYHAIPSFLQLDKRNTYRLVV